MRHYQSVKIVKAAQITWIADEFTVIGMDSMKDTLDLVLDNQPVKTCILREICHRMPGGKPKVGDYLVEYEDGYVSISPGDVFEKGYVPLAGQFGFGTALTMLKAGKRVAREGWNGKGMFLFLVPGSTFTVNRPPLLGIYEEGTEIQYHAHIDMKTAQGYVVPWLASQADMLADDWHIVDAA